MKKRSPQAWLVLALLTAGCLHWAAEIKHNRYGLRDENAVLTTAGIAEQNAAFCAENGCTVEPMSPVNVLFDPHAHLSMEPGMNLVFSGTPIAVEQTPEWHHMFSEKMAVDRVLASGVRLIVVCLYANKFAAWPQTAYAAMQEEIDRTRAIVDMYPESFSIATTSEQARRILASGRIALVFAMEGAEWGMRSPEDVAYWYNQGVRMVNPLHLYDSWIGGSDMQGGVLYMLNPPALKDPVTVNGRWENRNGLTREGAKLFSDLADFGYIIDVSHLSRKALRDVDALPALKDVPLMNSHMPNLYETGSAERAVDREAFEILRRRGGLLGLVPNVASPKGLDPFPELCSGTVETFARTYALAVSHGGGMPIALASDFNGGVAHLRPTHGPDGCYDEADAKTEFDRKGLADAGFVPDLLAGMKARGVDVSPMYASSGRFLELWERTEARKVR